MADTDKRKLRAEYLRRRFLPATESPDLITAKRRIYDQFGLLPSLETADGMIAHTQVIARLLAGLVRDFCRLHGDDAQAIIGPLNTALADEVGDRLYVGIGWPDPAADEGDGDEILEDEMPEEPRQ